MSDARTPRYVTADMLVIRSGDEGETEVLLIKRRPESRAYPDSWALPGGHVDSGELIADAANRELLEEAGINVHGVRFPPKFLGYYDAPGRDPRGEYVSFLFGVEVPWNTRVQAGDDARDIMWVPVWDLHAYKLAFDHAQMIDDHWRKFA